jgi:hypothetical protein
VVAGRRRARHLRRVPADDELVDADAVAGGWVGTQPLGRALQKLFQLNQDSDDERAARRLSSHPALRDRLARLGERQVQIGGAGPGRDR